MSTAQSVLRNPMLVNRKELFGGEARAYRPKNKRSAARCLGWLRLALIGAGIALIPIATTFAAIYGVQHRAWVLCALATLAGIIATGALLVQTMRMIRAQAPPEWAHFARLALAGEMAASIVHEVTQPLSSILVNLDAIDLTLAKGAGDVAALKEVLDDLRRDGHRATQIAQRLRAFLSDGELRFQKVDLNAVVAGALELIKTNMASHRVNALANLAADRPLVNADAVQLQQVLLTLFNNAVEAMTEIPFAARHLEVTTRCIDENRVEVIVSDRGPKVTREQLEHAFDPYFTTKENGMGLGLSIARSIVCAHRGVMWMEENIPNGASFHFTIPIVHAASVQHREPQPLSLLV